MHILNLFCYEEVLFIHSPRFKLDFWISNSLEAEFLSWWWGMGMFHGETDPLTSRLHSRTRQWTGVASFTLALEMLYSGGCLLSLC